MAIVSEAVGVRAKVRRTDLNAAAPDLCPTFTEILSTQIPTLRHIPGPSKRPVARGFRSVLSDFTTEPAWETLHRVMCFARLELAAPNRGGKRRHKEVARLVAGRLEKFLANDLSGLWTDRSYTFSATASLGLEYALLPLSNNIVQLSVGARAGYQFLYVDGVALATENFNTTPPFAQGRIPFLDDDGTAVEPSTPSDSPTAKPPLPSPLADRVA